jgi:acyl-CoA hydrolase
LSRQAKSMQESYTRQTKLVLPGDSNNHDTLFGGLLMKYIDEVAALAAIRHAQKECVTASNDGVHFQKPILKGHIVDLEAYVASVGRTSIEVFVKISTEDSIKQERSIAATSFLTFVALDSEGKPTSVPDVYPETEEQRLIRADWEKRRKARQEKRKETLRILHLLD